MKNSLLVRKRFVELYRDLIFNKSYVEHTQIFCVKFSIFKQLFSITCVQPGGPKYSKSMKLHGKKYFVPKLGRFYLSSMNILFQDKNVT